MMGVSLTAVLVRLTLSIVVSERPDYVGLAETLGVRPAAYSAGGFVRRPRGDATRIGA
jgi:hypothetical protein